MAITITDYREPEEMEMRDLFALEAMKIYLQKTSIGNSGMFLNDNVVGHAAYAVADDMLAARNNQLKQEKED